MRRNICHLLITFQLTFAIGVVTARSYHDYQFRMVTRQEARLRVDLYSLRQMIDQYAADKGQLPQQSADLLTAGYLREIPVDPVTGEKDWQWVIGEDTASTQGGQGIIDVHSSSSATSSAGMAYSDW